VGVDLFDWLERLEQEQANFRAALRFSLEREEPDPGLCLAAGFWVLWAHRGSWAEGRDWIARLVALPGAADHLAAGADALSAAGQMAFQEGDNASAYVLLAEAVDLQRRIANPRGLAMAVTHAGLPARASGEYSVARALHGEGVALSQAAGNRGYEVLCLGSLAHAVYLKGDYELARTFAKQSLAMLSLGRRGGPASVHASIPLYVLGRVALCTGDYAAVRQGFEQTLALWRNTGDARSAPGALVGLGSVALAEGDPGVCAQSSGGGVDA
jgi:tetratricopeptide (TPR) repeat protein